MKQMKVGLRYQAREIKKCIKKADPKERKSCVQGVAGKYSKTKIEKDAKKKYATYQRCLKKHK